MKIKNLSVGIAGIVGSVYESDNHRSKDIPLDQKGTVKLTNSATGKRDCRASDGANSMLVVISVCPSPLLA